MMEGALLQRPLLSKGYFAGVAEMADSYWWPLERSEDLEKSFHSAHEDLSTRPVELDSSLAAEVSQLITATLKSGLPTILAKDTLPNLCHLFVGWGNALYEGARFTSLIRRYVHLDEDGREFIYQAHGEGDFHPWQTFCYMVMGGIDPDLKLTETSNLRDLAANSSYIHTQAMEDLGHLLFSYAHFRLDDSLIFRFDEAENDPITLDIYGMVANAARAHHFGSFKVCRKFHLTEGLCAISSRKSGLDQLRPFAQGFFSGQMELLVLLHRILSLADRVEDLSNEEQAELGRLRGDLRMGRLFENHLYYVGHLVELACFGLRFGFEMSNAQKKAATACLNICNALICRFASGLARAEVLLPFSHYRRGLTLWGSAASGVAVPLDAFTANFDEIEALPASATPNLSPVFNFAVSSDEPRERFKQVLDEYIRACPGLPEPRGAIKHFRRLSPAGWHRQLHYEFLDYGDKIGAEIHFENTELTKLLPSIRESVKGLVGELGAAPSFEFYYNRGAAAKLALVFSDDSVEPGHIVHAMRRLMHSTQPSLEAQRRAD